MDYLTENQRDDIIDRLPSDMVIWDWEDELEAGQFTDRTWLWWREALGHPYSGHGYCRTCGAGTPCLLAVFYEAVKGSTLREVSKLGLLAPVTSLESEGGKTKGRP